MPTGQAWTMPADQTRATSEPDIRRIGIAEVREAVRLGIDDFLAIPTQLLFLGLIYPLVGLVAARAAWGGDILPLLYPMVAGLSLMGPVAALGLTELSRRRERGWHVGWMDAFRVIRSPAIGSIIGLSLILAAIFLAWLVTAQAIWRGTIGPAHPASLGAMLHAVLDTEAGWRLLLLGNLAGFGFAVLVLMLSVVTFPLLLDRPVTLGTAIRASLRACWRNPGPMALWGLIVAAGLLLGCVPAFVGLAVAMPVLGHASWHLYRRVVA
jgi:uncharacterized membrane protein